MSATIEMPIKGLAFVGLATFVGGAATGFSFAERLYATDAQKSSVRTMASIAAVAVVATATVGAIGVVRARS